MEHFKSEFQPFLVHSLSLDKYQLFLIRVKGTLSVILSDPPCKDSNVRFKTVPMKP